MYKVIFASAAPFLIAACGEATPVDEVEPQPMQTAPAGAEIALAEIPANSLRSIDYPGSYLQGGTRLVLNEDKTYEISRADGTTDVGTYSELEDGSRIRLEDFDGGPAWFSVGQRAIYRLPDESTPYGEITVEGEYRRDLATPTPTSVISPAPAAPTPDADTAEAAADEEE